MTVILDNNIVLPGYPHPDPSVSPEPVPPAPINSVPIKHNPWDRLPGEQDAAWEAYRRYRDMPSSKRNLTQLKTILIKERDVAEESGDFDNVPTIRYDTLNRWMREYDWVQRTAAWDVEIDRVWQEESLLVVREAARRHWENSVELQNVGKLALALIDPKVLAEKFPQEVRRFITEGSEMERETLGINDKQGTEQASNAVLVIQIVERLERQLASKENLAIEGEFKPLPDEDIVS